MSAEGVARIRAVAASLRLGMDAQGHEGFVGLVDWLARDPAAGALLPRLEPLLGEIVRAQERGDTLGLADLLEFRLQPLLRISDKDQGSQPS